MKFTTVDEMRERNAERKVVDYTANGTCSGCGNCCSFQTPLTKDEFKKLKGLFHNGYNKAFMKKFEQGTSNLMCPFFQLEEKKCRIYDDRPSVCRAFVCNDDSITTLKKAGIVKREYLMYELYQNNIKKLLSLIHKETDERSWKYFNK